MQNHWHHCSGKLRERAFEKPIFVLGCTFCCVTISSVLVFGCFSCCFFGTGLLENCPELCRIVQTCRETVLPMQSNCAGIVQTLVKGYGFWQYFCSLAGSLCWTNPAVPVSGCFSGCFCWTGFAEKCSELSLVAVSVTILIFGDVSRKATTTRTRKTRFSSITTNLRKMAIKWAWINGKVI